MASHKTLGIELGATSIHIAICEVDDQKVVVERMISRSLPKEPEEMHAALHAVSDEVYSSVQASGLAIGLVTDSTEVLTTHQKLTFNDPHVIENVLPQTMSDTWKIDEDSQLAFQVGDRVKAVQEDDMDGYDVLVINLSRARLVEQIELLKPYRLEPHIVIPELQAFPYALNIVFSLPSDAVSVILDIGSDKASLCVMDDGKVVMTRAFKLGSNRITESIAQAFELSFEDAEQLKRNFGFLSLPGLEQDTFANLVHNHRFEQPPADLDIVKLSNACAQGMGMLFSGVNQSLMSFAASSRKDPKILYVTGGGAKIAGIEDWYARNMGLPTTRALPLGSGVLYSKHKDLSTCEDFSIGAINAAIVASVNANTPLTLNLRHGDLAHKGSLEFIKDNIWLIASIIVVLITATVFMMVSRAKMINAEHDQLKAALERTTEEVFGKKMTSLKQIKSEVGTSKGYNFIPKFTAFSHFEWLSNEITNNMTDIDMELSYLDIDTQRKIITLRGEVAGEDGLPRFIQLLEQYECFPDEIPFPKTTQKNDRLVFQAFRIEANHCVTEDEVSE